MLMKPYETITLLGYLGAFDMQELDLREHDFIINNVNFRRCASIYIF